MQRPVSALVASSCPTRHSPSIGAGQWGKGDEGRDGVVTPIREDADSLLGDLASGTLSKVAH